MPSSPNISASRCVVMQPFVFNSRLAKSLRGGRDMGKSLSVLRRAQDVEIDRNGIAGMVGQQVAFSVRSSYGERLCEAQSRHEWAQWVVGGCGSPIVVSVAAIGEREISMAQDGCPPWTAMWTKTGMGPHPAKHSHGTNGHARTASPWFGVDLSWRADYTCSVATLEARDPRATGEVKSREAVGDMDHSEDTREVAPRIKITRAPQRSPVRYDMFKGGA